jgi:hypothetical protein
MLCEVLRAASYQTFVAVSRDLTAVSRLWAFERFEREEQDLMTRTRAKARDYVLATTLVANS